MVEPCQSGTTPGPPVRVSLQGAPMNPFSKILVGGAIAGSALLGGAVGATLLGTAQAQTSTTTAPAATATAPSSTAPAPGPRTPDRTKGGHQANGTTGTALPGHDLPKA